MANETVLFKRGDSVTITSTPVTDGQILFDTSGNGKMYLDNGTDRLEMGGAITVDASLSKTSTNAIQNKAVTGNILNSLAEVSAATQQNTIAGALALKEVNSSLGGFEFYTDEQGKAYYKPTGADSGIPFSNAIDLDKINVIVISTNNTSNTFQTTIENLNPNNKYLIISHPTWTPETTAKVVDTDGEYISKDISTAAWTPTVFIVENATYITLRTIMSVKNMSVNVICFEI